MSPNNNVVCVASHNRSYVFDAASDSHPSMQILSLDEIEYINSHSTCFRTGLLTFSGREKTELYKHLNIPKKDVLTNQDIAGIIQSPTVQGLQRILDVKEMITFERIRNVLYMAVRERSFDLSKRVIDIIEARYRELAAGHLKTAIEIVPKDTEPATTTAQVADLKSQIAALQHTIDELKNSAGSDNPDTAKKLPE